MRPLKQLLDMAGGFTGDAYTKGRTSEAVNQIVVTRSLRFRKIKFASFRDAGWRFFAGRFRYSLFYENRLVVTELYGVRENMS